MSSKNEIQVLTVLKSVLISHVKRFIDSEKAPFIFLITVWIKKLVALFMNHLVTWLGVWRLSNPDVHWRTITSITPLIFLANSPLLVFRTSKWSKNHWQAQLVTKMMPQTGAGISHLKIETRLERSVQWWNPSFILCSSFLSKERIILLW